jgi:hypothetical protein
MFKLSFSLLAAALLISCAPGSSAQSEPVVVSEPGVTPSPGPGPSASPLPISFIGDRTFEPFLRKFLADGASYGKSFRTSDLSMRFGDLAAMGYPDAIGLCYPTSKRIFVLKSWWDAQNPVYREEMIHHELAHCLLNRDHYNSLYNDGHPVSLMLYHVFDQRLYSPWRSYYMKELFTRQTSIAPQMLSDEPYVCGTEAKGS